MSTTLAGRPIGLMLGLLVGAAALPAAAADLHDRPDPGHKAEWIEPDSPSVERYRPRFHPPPLPPHVAERPHREPGCRPAGAHGFEEEDAEFAAPAGGDPGDCDEPGGPPPFGRPHHRGPVRAAPPPDAFPFDDE